MKKEKPCKDYPERFTACSDNCPKDARGEYGYAAYITDREKIKRAEKEYKMQRREEFLRGEQCEAARQRFINSVSGRKNWENQG